MCVEGGEILNGSRWTQRLEPAALSIPSMNDLELFWVLHHHFVGSIASGRDQYFEG